MEDAEDVGNEDEAVPVDEDLAVQVDEDVAVPVGEVVGAANETVDKVDGAAD
jgi:hypothetical protein